MERSRVAVGEREARPVKESSSRIRSEGEGMENPETLPRPRASPLLVFLGSLEEPARLPARAALGEHVYP